MARRLEHTVGSYGKIFLIGMLIGGICRLADYFPGDTLWSLSSIQTLLGFWVITNTLIVLFSTSHLCAGESSFLYMFGMTLSFYGLQAVLGTFIPLLSGEFRFSLFVMFSILSIPCGMAAFFLYDWNRDENSAPFCTHCRWGLWPRRRLPLPSTSQVIRNSCSSS